MSLALMVFLGSLAVARNSTAPASPSPLLPGQTPEKAAAPQFKVDPTKEADEVFAEHPELKIQMEQTKKAWEPQ